MSTEERLSRQFLYQSETEPMAMAMRKVAAGLAEWTDYNFGTVARNPAVNCLLGAMEELGELCHAHLKGEQGIRHTADEIEALKKDAVADVIIFLFDYCHRSDIDLGQALADTALRVVKRDFRSDPMLAKGDPAEILP